MNSVRLETLKCVLLLLGCLTTWGAFAQPESYSYQRTMEGVDSEWHSLELPDEIFSRLNNSLTDFRVFGITEKEDTIEVPYLMKIKYDEQFYKKVKFRLVNKVKDARNTYFTFIVPGNRIVNHVDLDFNRKNFDWRIDVEGSQNQKKWFSIRRNYRIVGISNSYTDYQFTRLYFQDVKFKYLRITLRNKWFTYFKDASLYELGGKKGYFRDYAVSSFSQKNNKDDKTSIIEFEADMKVPVSEMSLKVKDKVDYVRPLLIEYLSDSSKTEKGYIYHYKSIKRSMLSSFEKSVYSFSGVRAKRFRLTVSNYDNQPVEVESATLRGNVHELTLRFPKAKKFFLAYGKEKDRKPSYDLMYFKENIPKALRAVTLGEERKVEEEPIIEEDDFSEQEIYLWLAIILVSVLLGVFVIKMMKAEKKNNEA